MQVAQCIQLGTQCRKLRSCCLPHFIILQRQAGGQVDDQMIASLMHDFGKSTGCLHMMARERSYLVICKPSRSLHVFLLVQLPQALQHQTNSALGTSQICSQQQPGQPNLESLVQLLSGLFFHLH